MLFLKNFAMALLCMAVVVMGVSGVVAAFLVAYTLFGEAAVIVGILVIVAAAYAGVATSTNTKLWE